MHDPQKYSSLAATFIPLLFEPVKFETEVICTGGEVLNFTILRSNSTALLLLRLVLRVSPRLVAFTPLLILTVHDTVDLCHRFMDRKLLRLHRRNAANHAHSPDDDPADSLPEIVRHARHFSSQMRWLIFVDVLV